MPIFLLTIALIIFSSSAFPFHPASVLKTDRLSAQSSPQALRLTVDDAASSNLQEYSAIAGEMKGLLSASPISVGILGIGSGAIAYGAFLLLVEALKFLVSISIPIVIAVGILRVYEDYVERTQTVFETVTNDYDGLQEKKDPFEAAKTFAANWFSDRWSCSWKAVKDSSKDVGLRVANTLKEFAIDAYRRIFSPRSPQLAFDP